MMVVKNGQDSINDGMIALTEPDVDAENNVD